MVDVDMPEVVELPRRSLLEGPAWDAVVAAVIAEAEMLAQLQAEQLAA